MNIPTLCQWPEAAGRQHWSCKTNQQRLYRSLLSGRLHKWNFINLSGESWRIWQSSTVSTRLQLKKKHKLEESGNSAGGLHRMFWNILRTLWLKTDFVELALRSCWLILNSGYLEHSCLRHYSRKIDRNFVFSSFWPQTWELYPLQADPLHIEAGTRLPQVYMAGGNVGFDLCGEKQFYSRESQASGAWILVIRTYL